MLAKIFAVCAVLAGPTAAHLALWHPSGYGFNGALDPYGDGANGIANPIKNRPYDQWFKRFHNNPPAHGEFMELPAGGTFVGEINCVKQGTSYGGWPPADDAMACGYNGNPDSAMHLEPNRVPRGSALAIAYNSDINSLQAEDFTVISVNYNSPWFVKTPYKIPAGLAACPEDGCHCAWGWAPKDSRNFHENYINLFKCKVTNAGNIRPANPQVPGPGVTGPKQLLLWAQAERNNVEQERWPQYKSDWGFTDGAQDIGSGSVAAPAPTSDSTSTAPAAPSSSAANTSNGNTEGNSNTEGNGNTNSNTNSDANTNANANSDTNSNTNTNTNTNSDTNADKNTDKSTKSNTSGTTNTNTNANKSLYGINKDGKKCRRRPRA